MRDNEDSEPLVSVIIPVFNRSGIFARTLRTAIGQSYANLEIIVIDDHSEDFSQLVEVVGTFSDGRIKLLRNAANMNGAYSRNVGILEARGKYIAFLDSDDEWSVDKIRLQVREAEKRKGSFLVYSRSLVHRRTYDEILPARPIREGESVANYLFAEQGYMPTPSLFLPAELARQNLFNPRLRRHQDYDFLLRLGAKGTKFIMLDDSLVQVNFDPSSRSEARGASYLRSMKFLKEYTEYFDRKSANCFWIKNVGFYMARSGRRLGAVARLFREKRYLGVDLKDLIVYLAYFITINSAAYHIFEKIYLHYSRYCPKRFGNGEAS